MKSVPGSGEDARRCAPSPTFFESRPERSGELVLARSTASAPRTHGAMVDEAGAIDPLDRGTRFERLWNKYTSLDCIAGIAVFTWRVEPAARRKEEPMRVYEAIVRGLESIGADAAFGGAGENAAGMMIALKHSQKIRSVITRNEQAASFAACGY